MGMQSVGEASHDQSTLILLPRELLNCFFFIKTRDSGHLHVTFIRPSLDAFDSQTSQ